MNKRIVLVCLIVITLLFGFTFFLKKNYNFENIIINKEDWNEIINSRNLSDSILITNLKFNDYELLFDNTNNTWYYSLIENSSNMYNPYINYTSNQKQTNIAVSDKITQDTIKNNKTLELLIYNDTEYNVYNIKCTTLPILNINYDESEIISREDKVDMELYLFDNRYNSTNRVIKTSGEIHARGKSTYDYPKKGYKISLTTKSVGNNKRDNNISLLGMRQDDDWILYAGYNDQEKIRNVFASNLWYYSCSTNNMFNIVNGNEYKYVELFFNNKYWGLYALGFPIDEKQLNLNSDNEYIFKKVNWIGSEKAILTEPLDKLDGYELVSKSKDEKNAWNALKEYYYTLQTTDQVKELYNISDIENVIDYYLFSNLIQAWDNSRGTSVKNVFISIKNYKGKNTVLYTPWDLDITFGNVWSDIYQNYTSPYANTSDKNAVFNLNSIYFLQNLKDQEINNLIKNRYKYLRENYWSNNNIEELILKYSEDIYESGAFSRDKARWPSGTYGNESDKLNIFKKFVFERLEYLDEYIDSL